MNMRSHSPDKSAKAAIRDEAVRLFAERGVDAVTVRDLAAAASVSPALVMQHYGSKDGLREAVDQHVVSTFEKLLGDVATAEPNGSLYESVVAALPADSPVPRYIARLLVSGSEPGDTLFRGLFEVAKSALAGMVAAGAASEGRDMDARAAFLLINDLAVIMLHERVAGVLGVDPLTRDGMARWAPEVLAVYSGGLGRDSR